MLSPRVLCRRQYSSMIDQVLVSIMNDAQKKQKAPAARPPTSKAPLFQASSRSILKSGVAVPQNRNRIATGAKSSPFIHNGSTQQQQRQDGMRRNARRPDELRLRTGSERLQKAFKMTLHKIRQINPRGHVLEVKTGSGLTKTDVSALLKSINLDEEGLEFVNVDQKTQLPLVKRITAQRAGELYSDHLHEKMTKDSGLEQSKYRIHKREQAAKDSNLKQYKLNWSLSLNDLLNVKLKDVMNQLIRGCKVEIFLATKQELRSIGIGPRFLQKDQTQNQTAAKLDEIEVIKREKIVTAIKEFIEEQDELLKITMTMEGSHLDRLLLTLRSDPPSSNTATAKTAANSTNANNDDEKKRLKELKKQERREREKLKAMRKK